MTLPIDIDTVYDDDPLNPGKKLHQQHHDTLHGLYNDLEVAGLDASTIESKTGAQAKVDAAAGDRRVQAAGGAVPTDNVIAGSSVNAVASDLGAATISGGGQTANFANIIGGDHTTIGVQSTKTVSGVPNVTQTGTGANYSVIGGGYDNVAGGLASVITGFHNATALGTTHGTVSGGSWNWITAGDYGTISGGTKNLVTGTHGTVAGGLANSAVVNAVVGGGLNNTAAADSSTIAGGGSNEATGTFGTVAGGSTNKANATRATVGGGQTNTATGWYSTIGGGQTNTASGNHSTVPGGLSNTASGTSATAAGQTATASGSVSVALGRDVVASADYSEVGGRDAKAYTYGMRARASGKIAVQGDAQTGELTLYGQTTNATLTALGANGTVGLNHQMQHDSSAAVEVLVVARDTGTGDSKAWTGQGLIRNDTAAASAFVGGTPALTQIAADAAAAAWTAAFNTGTDSLIVQVTGEAAKTINWSVYLRIVEVVG